MSTQNALIVSNARRWPLLIDPQAQANKWIRKLEEQSGLVIVTPNDSDVMRRIEVAVENGRPVLIEGVGETLDAYLEPLLLRQVSMLTGLRWLVRLLLCGTSVMDVFVVGTHWGPQVFVKSGLPYMQLGASIIPYHRAFRLYLTTSLDNPHYLPEVSTKVRISRFLVKK